MTSKTGRALFGLTLAVAAPLIPVVTAPLAAAHDPECDTIMPVGDQLEPAFDEVEPQGVTPQDLGSKIREVERPLFQLSSPVAVDLRNWSDILASKLNHDGRYPQDGPDQLWLAADLGVARSHLLAARRYCVWSVYTLG